jgi:hypothetical protein
LTVGDFWYSPAARRRLPAAVVVCFFVIFVPSWWKIADPRRVTAYPNGASRTGRVSLVTSGILHHEGTKITKKREGGGGVDMVVWQAGADHRQQRNAI